MPAEGWIVQGTFSHMTEGKQPGFIQGFPGPEGCVFHGTLTVIIAILRHGQKRKAGRKIRFGELVIFGYLPGRGFAVPLVAKAGKLEG